MRDSRPTDPHGSGAKNRERLIGCRWTAGWKDAHRLKVGHIRLSFLSPVGVDHTPVASFPYPCRYPECRRISRPLRERVVGRTFRHSTHPGPHQARQDEYTARPMGGNAGRYPPRDQGLSSGAQIEVAPSTLRPPTPRPFPAAITPTSTLSRCHVDFK